MSAVPIEAWTTIKIKRTKPDRLECDVLVREEAVDAVGKTYSVAWSKTLTFSN